MATTPTPQRHRAGGASWKYIILEAFFIFYGVTTIRNPFLEKFPRCPRAEKGNATFAKRNERTDG